MQSRARPRPGAPGPAVVEPTRHGGDGSSPLRALLQHSAVRYLAVGGVAFGIDLGVLTLCFTVIGTPLWVATATGFWTSFFFNFFVQRRFSFASSGAVHRSFWRYGVLLAVNTVVTVVVVELFERSGLGFTAGKVVVTVAQTVWNYLAYRHWVFAAPSGAGAERTAERPTH